MSEIKTEGSFKIKAPEKKEPVAEQVKEAPEEVKAEPNQKLILRFQLMKRVAVLN